MFRVIFIIIWLPVVQPFVNTIRMSNSLNPDNARHFDELGLGPKCLRSLSEQLQKFDSFTTSLPRISLI